MTFAKDQVRIVHSHTYHPDLGSEFRITFFWVDVGIPGGSYSPCWSSERTPFDSCMAAYQRLNDLSSESVLACVRIIKIHDIKTNDGDASG